MTSILQPLDVSINKPMKVMLQEKWNDCNGSDDHTFTATGQMRKVELQDICQLIIDAWSKLDLQIIVKAFKKCCIANSMDGTENNMVWGHLVHPRETTGEANDNDDEDEADFSEENTMYHQIPQPYTDDEYHRMWTSDEESDTEFDGFPQMDFDDERCG